MSDYGYLSTLRHVRRELESFARGASMAVSVPCGECTACCREVGRIELTPEEIASGRYRQRDGALVHVDGGACAHLVAGKCDVYANRPAVCRMFDCRVHALSGLPLKDQPGITAAVIRFTPKVRTPEDMNARASVVSAATKARAEGGSVHASGMLAILGAQRDAGR